MDKIYERTMLFDFYGELLTEHQRGIYEDALYNDLSLGEIAQERGISRQGVHDLIRRCDKTLQGYEDRLHLVEKFSEARKVVAQIEGLTRMEEGPEENARMPGREMGTAERLEAIRKLSQGLLEKL